MTGKRDSKGRWLPGQSGGGRSPGRPKREKELEYLEALNAAISPEEWGEACGVALARAMAGDSRYFKILAEYFMEKMTMRIDTTSDISKVTIYLPETDEYVIPLTWPEDELIKDEA